MHELAQSWGIGEGLPPSSEPSAQPAASALRRQRLQSLHHCCEFLLHNLFLQCTQARGELVGTATIGWLSRSRWVRKELSAAIRMLDVQASSGSASLPSDAFPTIYDVAEDIRIQACLQAPEMQFARHRAIALSQWEQSNRGWGYVHVSKIKSALRLKHMDIKGASASREVVSLNDFVMDCLDAASKAACSFHAAQMLEGSGCASHLDEAEKQALEQSKLAANASYQHLADLIEHRMVNKSQQHLMLLCFGMAEQASELGAAAGVAAACDGYVVLGSNASEVQAGISAKHAEQNGVSLDPLNGFVDPEFVDFWQTFMSRPDAVLSRAL